MNYEDKDKGADMDKAMPDALKQKMEEMKDSKDKKDMDKAMDKRKSEDAESDDEPMADKMDKSLNDTISVFEKLLKSSPTARKDELLQKAQTGALDEAERMELVKSLQGDTGTEAKLSDEMVKAMYPEGEAGDELKKAMDIDVDGFLATIHGGVTSALETLGESLQKSMSERSEREFILAKGMRDALVAIQAQRAEMDALRKSLEDFSRMPASGFRSRRVPAEAALEKSFAGQASAEGQLSARDINDGFAELLKSGTASVGGEDILVAAAKFESTGHISPAALAEISALRKRV